MNIFKNQNNNGNNANTYKQIDDINIKKLALFHSNSILIECSVESKMVLLNCIVTFTTRFIRITLTLLNRRQSDGVNYLLRRSK